MKLMVGQEFTSTRYPITIDKQPGAIELNKVNNDIQARIFVVSPKSIGNFRMPVRNSSGSSFIMDNYGYASLEVLSSFTNEEAVIDSLTTLIRCVVWDFCAIYGVEVNPIEFKLNQFVKLYIQSIF